MCVVQCRWKYSSVLCVYVVYMQVEFSPTKTQLAEMVGSIAGHLTAALSDIQRLPDLLTRSKCSKDVIYHTAASSLSTIRSVLYVAGPFA